MSLFLTIAMFPSAPLVSLTLASVVFAQTYSATDTPQDAPNKSEQGQSGTNQCGTGSDQNSMCQNVYGACARHLPILARVCPKTSDLRAPRCAPEMTAKQSTRSTTSASSRRRR